MGSPALSGSDTKSASSGGSDAVCFAVIVEHDSGPCLAQAVESLLASPAVSAVVVVDNASVDAVAPRLAHLAVDERVTIAVNEDNVGFAVACNQGVAAGPRDTDVLFFNPDCVAPSGAVETLVATMGSTPDVVACGPLLLNPDGSEQAGGRRLSPTPWRCVVRSLRLTRFRRVHDELFADYGLENTPLPDHPVPVEALSGACMLIRRSAFDAVGGFDEGYFLHCEDLDLSESLRRNGGTLLFVSAARVNHVHGACSRRRPYFVEWHKHRGMVRYFLKFQRHDQRWFMAPLVIIGVALRFAAVVVVGSLRSFAWRLKGRSA